MSAVLDHHDHAHDDHGHAPAGWRRWVYATNHKDIGTLYLLFSFAMLMVGGVLALLIRAELFQPGLQIVNPELFNQFTTMHGIIMVFGAIMPAFVGFANWMLPLQVGASDMAFARMNNFSFWLMIPAALMLVGSFFMPGGAPAAQLFVCNIPPQLNDGHERLGLETPTASALSEPEPRIDRAPARRGTVQPRTSWAAA